MATARETINLATRKLKVRGRGATLTAAEAIDALADLNTLFESLWGCGGSYPYVQVRVSGAYDVSAEVPAQRLLCVAGAAITLPCLPADGARVQAIDVNSSGAVTIASNGMLIDGGDDGVTVPSGGAVTLMFRGDLGGWKSATALGMEDDLPTPAAFDGDIALMLADTMTEYGQTLLDADQKRVPEARRRLRARYVKPSLLRPDSAISRLGGAATGWDDCP
jgi:hypothetical protein